MRGISGVVIAVLLTVIGVIAVLAFWGSICQMFPEMCGGDTRVIIESASLRKSGDSYLLTVGVREIGGKATTIENIKLIRDNPDSPICQGSPKEKSLEAGQRRTIILTCSSGIELGKTYYVIVEYTKRGTKEVTEPSPVTAG